MTNGELWNLIEERVWELLRPLGIICPRCGASIDTLDDRCLYIDDIGADEPIPCAGLAHTDRAYDQAEREAGV